MMTGSWWASLQNNERIIEFASNYAQERFPEKSQIPTEKKIEISLDRILQDPGPGSKGSGFL